jgi:hypothetical protein
MRIFEKMIFFWLVLLKLEISYRKSSSFLKDFGFVLEDLFLKIIFLHGEIYLN